MSYTPLIGDASSTKKGVIELSGDLAGTATSPVVAKVNGVSILNIPSSGQILTANGASSASWQTPPSAGSSAGNYLTPQQFGAKGDGVTDDTAAMQKFFTAVFSGSDITSNPSHYGFIPDGMYKLTRPPSAPSPTHLQTWG